MIKIYNWVICKLFKKCAIDKVLPRETPFQKYCKEKPWALECRIYED